MMLLGTALMVLSHGSEARIYKWVDEDGATHYSQNKPPGRSAEELSVNGPRTTSTESNDECASLACRAGRLESERREKEEAARKIRAAAARAARVPVFPTQVEETDDEKITRLVAECKGRRGSKCDSHEEKRRMLLQNVDLTQAERRALRGLTPSQQRRVLLQRIPKQYRNID